ncbi:MAG: PAS domain S-box protein, partial [Proteobacteria bacterium]|nr:PAS domain S-box protein [Pseudomonadota bacterium]
MISAEKCLAQIIEKSPSNIYMFDVDTLRFVYANAAATQTLGHTIEELREMTVLDIIPGHTVNSFRKLLLPLTQDCKISQEVVFETICEHKNGSTDTVEFRIQRGNYDNNPVFVAFALDNSKRIQTEKVLREKEKRFSVAEQLAHIGIWEMNIVSNTLLWSDEVYRIFGLRPQQIGATYKAFKEVVHPDDWEMVEDAYVKSLKRRTPYNIEHRLLLKDGSIKYVIQHYESFFDDNGRAFRSVGTIQDITTQKEQEKDLLRFRTAIDASPDAIYFTNPETMRFLYVNRAATQRTGYSREQLLQFGPERILNIDRVQIKRDYDEAVAAGDKGAVGEVKIITKSGVRLWSELRRHALLMDDQWTLITFARDITERKKHEDELLQFRAAMDVSPDAIAITDVDSMRFLYVNEVAADRLGYTRDELLRLSPTDTLGIDSRALKRIYDEVIAAGDKGKGTSMEMVIITKTGVELWSDIRRRAIQLD